MALLELSMLNFTGEFKFSWTPNLLPQSGFKKLAGENHHQKKRVLIKTEGSFWGGFDRLTNFYQIEFLPFPSLHLLKSSILGIFLHWLCWSVTLFFLTNNMLRLFVVSQRRHGFCCKSFFPSFTRGTQPRLSGNWSWWVKMFANVGIVIFIVVVPSSPTTSVELNTHPRCEDDFGIMVVTLPQKTKVLKKRPCQKEMFIFQPSIFRWCSIR